MSKKKHRHLAPVQPTAPPPPASPISPAFPLPYALCIILAAFILYANTLGHQFIYGDDEHMFVKNVYLSDWRFFPNLLTENVKAGFGQMTNHYRPVQMGLYGIIAHTAGITPWPFHFLNILCHAASGLFLFLLLKDLFPELKLWQIAGMALLWVAHPIQVEDIAMANGTATPLHGAWLLASLWAFARSLDRQQQRPRLFWFCALGAFAGALLSKESAIVLPALILGLHWTLARLNRAEALTIAKALSFHLPFWALAGLYMLLRLTVFNFADTLNFYQGTSNVFTENLIYRFYTLMTVLAHGLKILILPIGLHPERNWPVFASLLSAPVLASAAGLGALLILAAWAVNKEPRISFGVFWFFAAYAPMSNLLAKINALFWEHWFYFPSLGMFIALAAATVAWPRAKTTLMALTLSAIPVLSAATIYRNRFWRNSETYFSYCLRYEPETAKLWNNLAMAVSEKGDERRAIEYYKEAVRLNDAHPETHHNLANAYSSLGEIALAEEEFKKAIAMAPQFYHSHLSLAGIEIYRKNYKRAIVYLETAVGINPHLDQAKQVLEALKSGQFKPREPTAR
ncbi:MAG: tetratricopeptide repeat protein [Elusimicrobia bacterium]|nr:tetratricopeptide repeat protein [Elusimicrobiota bacterium]